MVSRKRHETRGPRCEVRRSGLLDGLNSFGKNGVGATSEGAARSQMRQVSVAPSQPGRTGLHDIEAGQWGRAVAFTAGLEGFELVVALDPQAVEVGLVADDALHVIPGGEHTAADLFLKLFIRQA